MRKTTTTSLSILKAFVAVSIIITTSTIIIIILVVFVGGESLSHARQLLMQILQEESKKRVWHTHVSISSSGSLNAYSKKGTKIQQAAVAAALTGITQSVC